MKGKIQEMFSKLMKLNEIIIIGNYWRKFLFKHDWYLVECGGHHLSAIA